MTTKINSNLWWTSCTFVDSLAFFRVILDFFRVPEKLYENRSTWILSHPLFIALFIHYCRSAGFSSSTPIKGNWQRLHHSSTFNAGLVHFNCFLPWSICFPLSLHLCSPYFIAIFRYSCFSVVTVILLTSLINSTSFKVFLTSSSIISLWSKSHFISRILCPYKCLQNISKG